MEEPARPPRRIGFDPQANPRPDRVKDDRWWRIGLVVVGGLIRLALGIRFEGLENIPETGGAILAPNHVSVLDPVALALGPSRRGRTIRFLAAAEFFDRRRWLISFWLRRFQQIPVRRGLADWAALNEIAGVIHAGSLAGIFPEGRMGDGPLQPGRGPGGDGGAGPGDPRGHLGDPAPVAQEEVRLAPAPSAHREDRDRRADRRRRRPPRPQGRP